MTYIVHSTNMCYIEQFEQYSELVNRVDPMFIRI